MANKKNVNTLYEDNDLKFQDDANEIDDLQYYEKEAADDSRDAEQCSYTDLAYGLRSYDPTRAMIKEYCSVPLLSREEEIELAKRKDQGDKVAREKLVSSNMRLAIYYAKKFQYGKVEMGDLIQEAICGLLEAVNKYDYTINTKFSTYACSWIKKYLCAACRQSSTLYIPENQYWDLRKVKKIIDQFEEVNGRQPNPAELAKIQDITEDQAQVLLVDVVNLFAPVASLDAPINSEGEDGEVDITLGDCIEYDEVESIEDHIEESLMKEKKEAIFAKLTQTERDILVMYLKEDMTFASIGEKINKSTSRVEQIYKAVMERKIPKIKKELGFENVA